MGNRGWACALAFALAACGTRASPPGMDAGVDSQPCAPATPGADPTVQTYVITALTIDDHVSNAAPHTGFNLDGLCSDSQGVNDCGFEDYYSALDLDQNCPLVDHRGGLGSATYNACAAVPNPGCRVANGFDPLVDPGSCQGCIDNQLPEAIRVIASADQDVDVLGTLGTQIRTGHALMLVQLMGLDTVPDDPSVELTLLLAFDADTDCTNNLGGHGTFLVDDRSFVGGDPTQPRWHTTGSLVDGRWRATAPFHGVMFMPVIDIAPPIDFADMQLRFDVPSACDSLLQGNFGGSIAAQTAVDLLRARSGDPYGIVMTATGGLVDIPRGGVCYDAMATPPVLGAIGLGMGFTAARAQIVGHAATPGAVACGAGPAGLDAGTQDATVSLD